MRSLLLFLFHGHILYFQLVPSGKHVIDFVVGLFCRRLDRTFLLVPVLFNKRWQLRQLRVRFKNSDLWPHEDFQQQFLSSLCAFGHLWRLSKKPELRSIIKMLAQIVRRKIKVPEHICKPNHDVKSLLKTALQRLMLLPKIKPNCYLFETLFKHVSTYSVENG